MKQKDNTGFWLAILAVFVMWMFFLMCIKFNMYDKALSNKADRICHNETSIRRHQND